MPPDEIGGGRVLYLPFLKKYFLHWLDSQGNSGTDEWLNSRWDRPYELAPYRLMSLDGTIEVIPYPRILFEYGIKGFAWIFPSKVGLVIQRGREILLLQGDQLYRVWSGDHRFLPNEGIAGSAISPDGCKVAFMRFTDNRVVTPKPISIINLCEMK